MPRLEECLGKLEGDLFIDTCFPKPDATAGSALGHCLNKVSCLLRKEYPCTFKFGFTHCLSWRWHNNLYGYHHSLDKYHKMIGLYMSSTTTGAALMEAFLINLHSGSQLKFG